MNPYAVSIMLLLFFVFFGTILLPYTYDPNQHYSGGDVSINCGSTCPSAASGSRKWRGDVKKKFFSSVQVKGSSTTARVIRGHKLISDPIPYKRARLSRSQFSYTFRVNPGQKILRLHFNSAPYSGFERYKDFFAVEAGPFTLLSNFSASLAADALGVSSFVKEYCINIEQNQLLDVVFSPASSKSRDTYAFVNGIEITSVPAARSYFHMAESDVQLVGMSAVYVDSSTALETIRRMNITQDSVSPSTDDISYRSGTWATHDVPKHKGNTVNNVTWKVSVDVGFRYLVRLHFSKMAFNFTELGRPCFEVEINQKIVHTISDMVNERDEDSSQWYRDYIVAMKGGNLDGKRGILISLQSDHEFAQGHGPLEGFEILKLSNAGNSLAGPNPMLLARDSSCKWILHILLKFLGQKSAIVSAAMIVLLLVNMIVYKLLKIQEAYLTEDENMPSAKADRLCRRFSLAEIQLGTKNFSDAHFIGRGGFGEVYRGIIDEGGETVAIKRLKRKSSQGRDEFLTEIETLTALRHVNLVSLIGYCNQHKEMILVYDYMVSGTLYDHLFKKDDNIASLTWKQRLKICIGAGRGLDYLHTGHSIVHRDVKASNILLDEDFTAKVSDFGLAKHLGTGKLQQSHVSTKVKGTWGYLAPEYAATGKLTRASDIYAFGVVLLEVLSGRRAVDPRLAEDEQVLIWWAQENITKGKADQIVAPSLRSEISVDSLKTFVNVAERCVHHEPKKRPTMAQVVVQLEFALELEESSKSSQASDQKNNSEYTYLPAYDGARKTPESNDKVQKFVLRLDLQDDKIKQRKVLKTVSALSGINEISVDVKGKKLTVIGTVDPVTVISKLRKKHWQADIISMGPAKEPEKKEGPKKEEAKKEEAKEEEEKKEEPKTKKEEPKKEEAKKEDPKALEQELVLYYPPMNTYYYVHHSMEEDPNACTIC